MCGMIDTIGHADAFGLRAELRWRDAWPHPRWHRIETPNDLPCLGKTDTEAQLTPSGKKGLLCRARLRHLLGEGGGPSFVLPGDQLLRRDDPPSAAVMRQ
jgi:hypothetical protein